MKSAEVNGIRRIRIWANDIRKEKGEEIPLKQDSKVIAFRRLSVLNKYESDIKNGLSFTFPWKITLIK